MRCGTIPGVTKPVSRLVQGTANTVFDASKPDQAFALLDMALEYGINTFDTAHVYGEGNETLLGNWVHERGVRDQVVILAKGAHPMAAKTGSRRKISKRISPSRCAARNQTTLTCMSCTATTPLSLSARLWKP